MGNFFEEMNMGNFFWVNGYGNFCQVCLIDVRFQSNTFWKMSIYKLKSVFLAENDICC